MTWFLRQFRWILLVSGLLTTSMIYVAIAPRAALLSMFGEPLEGPVADVIVRTWFAVVADSVMIVLYAAYLLARPRP